MAETDELRNLAERFSELSVDIKGLTTEITHLATRDWTREYVQHQLDPVKDVVSDNVALLTKVSTLFDTHETKMQALAAAEKQEIEDRTWSARAKRWAPYIGFVTVGSTAAYFILKLVIERAIYDAITAIPK